MKYSLKTRHSQRGASALGVIFVLLIIGGIATVAIKIMPAYMEDITVTSALEDISEQPESRSLDVKGIQALIKKRLSVNGVKGLPDGAIKVVDDTGIRTIVVNYERRMDLFANIDAVVTFDHSYEIPSR